MTETGISLCMGIFLIFITACTPRVSISPPVIIKTSPIEKNIAVHETLSWRACRFKISWLRNTRPDSAVSLMMAHSVVGPVLEEHAKKISLWRFHRRASRDKTGHQFSFLFYSDPGVSVEVLKSIRKSSILEKALASEIIEKVIFDDPSIPTHPEIKDTSDSNWSPELQRNWPFYIMGVSSTWLGLITDVMRDSPPHDDDVMELLEQYRAAENRITSIWHQEGQHAFLHHLSAIFGYEPLRIRKDILF